MILKDDIIVLLMELQENGVDVDDILNKTISSVDVPLGAIKILHENRCLDILNFYEKLRKSYNDKKSKLYINIMKSDENTIEDPKSILTTLSALLNQILQYKATDPIVFYSNARADEILKVLNIYFKTFNLDPAMKLLTLFKADIKVLQSIK